MKFVYLLIGCLGIVAILILYFQLIAGGAYSVLFFNTYISMTAFTLYIIAIAVITGVCFTLGISWFLSSWDNLDDDFNV